VQSYLRRLRDDERKSSAVLSYLGDENAYTAAAMADTQQLQDELYKEMRARIQEADTSVATRWGWTLAEVGSGCALRPCVVCQGKKRGFMCVAIGPTIGLALLGVTMGSSQKLSGGQGFTEEVVEGSLPAMAAAAGRAVQGDAGTHRGSRHQRSHQVRVVFWQRVGCCCGV
jgi:hypothetical protein